MDGSLVSRNSLESSSAWHNHGRTMKEFRGLKKYASIRGCYYAVRLSAAEFLAKEGKQAGVIAMRESHPSFILPLGFWINRERIREVFEKKATSSIRLKKL